VDKLGGLNDPLAIWKRRNNDNNPRRVEEAGFISSRVMFFPGLK
jgi:hypothetical protein